jgi:hypothetical protein
MQKVKKNKRKKCIKMENKKKIIKISIKIIKGIKFKITKKMKINRKKR